MCTPGFKDYQESFENNHIDNKIWESVSKQKEITLLIGAGVTSCLVGSWDELLNELAVLRGVSDKRAFKPQVLRDYLTCNCDGCFFPKDMNVLEKGEYLRYSPTDQRIFAQKEQMGQWREKVFAGRVLFTVNRLIYRHLCDGAGVHVVDSGNILNYKRDFLNWCHNDAETPFNIKRRTLCKNRDVENELEKFSIEEIIDNLNGWYGISLDRTLLTDLIEAGTDITDQVYSMFLSLFDGLTNNTFRKQIKNTLNHKDLKGKSTEEKTKLFLVKIAAHLLWRPNYETLETLLTLCIFGKVARVITYNFDTIFDRLLNDPDVQNLLIEKYKPSLRKEPKRPRVSVYGITQDEPYKMKGFDHSAHSSALPIIHVHGIVDGEIPEPETIIFSETSYLTYQQFLLNPGGMKLAEACRKGSLLCVGFSGVDPNFRSIVRQIIHQKNAPVFSNDRENKVFITRSLEEVFKNYRINEDMSASDYEVAFLCANTYLDMLQHYYQHEVEVDVLWAKDFDRLSEHLKDTFGIKSKDAAS